MFKKNYISTFLFWNNFTFTEHWHISQFTVRSWRQLWSLIPVCNLGRSTVSIQSAVPGRASSQPGVISPILLFWQQACSSSCTFSCSSITSTSLSWNVPALPHLLTAWVDPPPFVSAQTAPYMWSLKAHHPSDLITALLVHLTKLRSLWSQGLFLSQFKFFMTRTLTLTSAECRCIIHLQWMSDLFPQLKEIYLR